MTLTELANDLVGRRCTLIGLARTNVALARYLVGRGARVRIADLKTREQLAPELELLGALPVELALGGYGPADIEAADVVFVTPAAPRDQPILRLAADRGIPVASEIELLFERCRAPIVGITGSAGKTTTTTLVGLILERSGREVYVGGNIGRPLIERIDTIPPTAWVVLELSSFQLEYLRRSARVGAILNVTPNHLDRHPTFEHYAESKFNLLRHQRPEDTAILGADDRVASSFAPRCNGGVRWFSGKAPVEIGAFRADGDLIARDGAGDAPICRVGDLRLAGAHNVLNVLAASAVARAVGAEVAAIRAVVTAFGGVEHRLEVVARRNGIDYVNDSIATSPERTLAALRSFDRPIILIAGGRSKHLPLDELAGEVARRARAMVAYGEMADELIGAVRPRVAESGSAAELIRVSGLDDALTAADRVARPGDVILLSPAGTSYDLYRDFEARGRHFKEIVRSRHGDATGGERG